MNHIRAVGFVDTWHMSSKLCASYRTRFIDDDSGHSIVRLRVDDGDTPLLGEWKSAKMLLTRIRNAAAAYMKGVVPELGRVWLDLLKPGSFIPWEADESDYSVRHVRLVINIVPSPGAFLYCGGDSLVLPVGQVNLVDMRALTGQLNVGDTSRINLTVDLAVPEAP